MVQEGLPGTLLSAWESSDGVLYAVGGTARSALVLRHDTNGWWQMDPGTSRTLWWVHGFSQSDVYAVGAAGVVTHYDGTRWTVEREGGAHRRKLRAGWFDLLDNTHIACSPTPEHQR